ncbi:unnamed protein product [Agarophyton chilense]|eukprot:gb/GEZJ01004859.1/.p1 GENE.gb/GEZJ01004859.1/~~gb/GEZJ01004859.1/.p1  ORF type:complete len:812 (-),score=104.83 gb/GEZJ01004859.1/:527-2962(-)
MTNLSGSSTSGATAFLSNFPTAGFLLLVWWACNNIYAIDAQILLTKFSSELLFIDLSVAQILVGMAMASLLSMSKPAFQANVLKEHQSSPLFSMRSVQYSSLAIGLFHLLGSVMTNSSYKLLGSTSTLMWKLTEPLAALVLKWLVLRESTPILSVFGMIMVLTGVLVSSANSFTVLSVSPIVLANLCFPMRNMLIKKDQRDSTIHHTTEQRYFLLQASSLPFALVILSYKFIFYGLQLPSFPYLIRNAVLFNSYQFASIALLERMDALTHSLLNTLKRFTGILVSAVALGDPFSLLHFIGLTMAAFGFPLYMLGKETDAAKNKKRRMRAFAFIQICILIAVISSSCVDVIRKPSMTGSDRDTIGTSWFDTSEKKSTLPVSTQSLPFFSSLAPWQSSSKVVDAPTSWAGSMVPKLEKRPSPVEISASKRNASNEYVIANLVSYPNAHIEYDNYEDALKDTGKNHGNLVWQFATMNRLVDFTSVTTCNNTRMTCQTERSDLGERQMMFYRPIANIFDLTNTMTFAYERLIVERDGDVLLFVGIGIQQFFQPDIKIDDLNPGEHIRTTPKNFKFTEDAMKMLSTLQKYKMPMFVRGQFTLEATKHAGYEYGISTGCPSLFINRDVLLGRSLATKYEALRNRIGDRSLKIAFNMKPQLKLTKIFVGLLNNYPNSYMYAQTLDDLNQMKKAGIPFNRIKFISDAEEWMESLREMDVAFGARIHGNMIALGAGIPGFVIAPDHRVLELVERMKVPHTTIYDARLKEDLDVAKLFTDVGFSGKEFDSNRCSIAKMYKEVFRRYGLRLSGHAEEISTMC